MGGEIMEEMYDGLISKVKEELEKEINNMKSEINPDSRAIDISFDSGRISGIMFALVVIKKYLS